MSKALDLTNRIIGRLTALGRVGKDKRGSWLWRCSCECGNTIDVAACSLNGHLVRSCGCLYDEIKGKQAITHGYAKTTTYNSWLAMRQRCYYEKSDEYFRYGERGINVCDRWLNSFENFLEDMGERPQGHTLDRIDSLKGYSKDNCKWSTPTEQARNTQVRVSSASGVKGVTFHSVQKKWQVSITVAGKTIYLGIYENLEHAIRVRLEAEEEYWK